MRIEKSKKYLCIKDVVMQETKDTAYFKGKVYESKFDGCVTNEMADDFHHWPEDDCTPLTETVFVEYVEYTWGEEVEVSFNGINWGKNHLYVAENPARGQKDKRYIVATKDGSIKQSPLIRKPEKVVELSLQQIADKFKIPVDKLKIVD